MKEKLKSWYYAAINSIAFYPLILSLLFLGTSFISIAFAGGPVDQWLSELFPIFGHSEADPARNLLSVLAGGLFSLTIFSFSMVMVVINQAANTYSPKILGGFLKDKRPQWILGYYIGSLIYCLPLMLFLAEEKEGQMPLSGILLALLFTIVAMFLFIRFIDYVSRSVKPYEISRRIYLRTLARMSAHKAQYEKSDYETYRQPRQVERPWQTKDSRTSGNFQNLAEERLCALCEEHSIKLKILVKPGDYVIANAPLFQVFPALQNGDILDEIHNCFYYSGVEDIDQNFYYGFRQMTEIAAKALSPGINDIGTARICIEHITDLLCHFASFPTVYGRGRNHQQFLSLRPVEARDLIELHIDEIRLCGRSDKNVIYALIQSCGQLLQGEVSAPDFRREVQNFAIKIRTDIENQHRDAAYLMQAWKEMVGRHF